MTGKPTRFVSFVPSKITRTGRSDDRSDDRLLCQICFKPFPTSKALRDHIGDFQLEVQQLTARMLEAQAHLPSLDNQHHAVSNGNWEASDGNNDVGGDDGTTDNDESDDGDDENAGSDDYCLGSEDHAKLRCPYTVCNRTKLFSRRSDLLRHSQLHIECYETCVFCRNSFNRVRPFLIHQCEAIRRGGDKAKEFYRKERCAQLRRYVVKRLDQILAQDNTSHERTRKRGYEATDGCSERQSSKAHMASVDSDTDRWIPAEDNSLGVPAPSNVHNFMQPTLIPSLQKGPATSTSGFFNTSFPFSQMERSANYTLGFAPIFEGITITPCYDQPLPFNTLHADYPAASSLQIFDLQAPALEQGGYGQTNGETETIPY